MATDNPVQDAKANIEKAIAELRAMGVTVPTALFRAAHAISYAVAANTKPA
jgi:hypothetical protein